MPDSDAVMDILEYCWKHYPDFSYTSSVEDFQLGDGGDAAKALLSTAARTCAALGGGFDYVFTGNYRHSSVNPLETRQVLDAYFVRGGRKPDWLTPFRQLDATDVYDAVPGDLAALLWWCHQPVKNNRAQMTPCHRCAPCRAQLGVSRMHAFRDRANKWPEAALPA